MEVVRAEPGADLWWELMAYARSCPWVAGEHLADLMRDGAFTEWESVFAALDGGKIVGFCTLMETDYYPENRYSPWISTVFVDESFRGRGICGKLVEAACGYAGEAGFHRAFIPSDIIGLYERYGFQQIDKLENYGGELDNIFARDI
ncbi:GNAT family N-acetyltransferase [Acutalibacter sp. 1XD8-36]|uniref:GNAT family N-acetyltransferase n=1 Tax=Acutalibacter sp. 1XD8-36 TaxID=2320852 RepID=UPI0014128BDA